MGLVRDLISPSKNKRKTLMRCKNCSTQNNDDAKFCAECGSRLDASEVEKPKRNKKLYIIVALMLVLFIMGTAVYIRKNGNALGGSLVTATPEESFEQYTSVHEGISSIEKKFTDTDGFVAEETIPELIEAVHTYVKSLPSNIVGSCEVGDEYVQVDLEMGFTYVFAPRRRHMLDGGSGMTISSYEQETKAFSKDRDDTIQIFDLKAEPDKVGVHGNSLIDSIAWYMVVSDSNQFHLDEFYDDEDVTLETIKHFRGNRVVLWEGHGIWTQQLGSQLQLSQKIDFLWWQKIWGEDFKEKRVVAYGDHIAVTGEFFNHYYKAGDLKDSVFYLGSCHSLRDDRLADTLVAKGAALVIGNTNAVSSIYQYEMRDSILSDMADYHTSISNALNDAKIIYGQEDPWCGTGEHTEVSFYPSSAHSVTLYGNLEEEIRKKDNSAQFTNYEYLASNLILDMYNDWSFASGRQSNNTEKYPDRCFKYINKDSNLYTEFSKAGIESTSKFTKNVTTCVVGEPSVHKLADKTYRVSVQYIYAQNSVDQVLYDSMLKSVSTAVWDVTMDGACKVTSLEYVSLDMKDDSATAKGDPEQVPGQGARGSNADKDGPEGSAPVLDNGKSVQTNEENLNTYRTKQVR